MRKISIAVLAVLIILPGFSIPLAEGATISISCTMPSIPGVNAPMIEEKSTRTHDTQPAVQEQAYSMPKTSSTSMLQADKEIVTKAAAPILVQTFYSR